MSDREMNARERDREREQHKTHLTPEQETLMVPLYAKVLESQRHDHLLFEWKAQEIAKQVDYDFASLSIPRKTVVTLCIRSNKIDAYAQAFVDEHPNCLVLHLGCGLDSRFLRIDNFELEWVDLDMPPVIELRRKFYDESRRYHMLGTSVTDLGWIDTIAAQGRPVMVIAEGLFMYLSEAEVKALILKLHQAFPGCELVFDVFSTLTAERVKTHPSLQETGAIVQWGIDDAREIEKWAQGIKLQEEWYFTEAEEIKKLSWFWRQSFRLASLSATARKAHRILYYRL
jgi:O-methyltransferase involved in polyketide biosynthesis